MGRRAKPAGGERTVVFTDMLPAINYSSKVRPVAAEYRGACNTCGHEYPVGTLIFRDSSEGWSRVECCGDKEDVRATGYDEPVSDYDPDGALVPLEQVMPRGRTKADACPKCFQIPSNAGVCGC